MWKRLVLVAILATVSAASGCCRCGCRGNSLRDTLSDHHWGCSQCGEFYWSEWFCDPPACHDPCDCCGNFCGPTHRPRCNPYVVGHHPTPAAPMSDEVFEER